MWARENIYWISFFFFFKEVRKSTCLLVAKFYLTIKNIFCFLVRLKCHPRKQMDVFSISPWKKKKMENLKENNFYLLFFIILFMHILLLACLPDDWSGLGSDDDEAVPSLIQYKKVISISMLTVCTGNSKFKKTFFLLLWFVLEGRVFVYGCVYACKFC